MPSMVDLRGRTFDRLSVLHQAPNIGRRIAWYCRCSCGSGDVIVAAASLTGGNTRSCGCLHRETAAKNSQSRRLTDEQKAESKKRRIRAQYDRHLRKKFGIDINLVEEMREGQSNCCAVCSEEFTRTPDLDHNHETSAIRGLLCHSCNLVLGLVKDNPVTLRSAAMYLESYGKQLSTSL